MLLVVQAPVDLGGDLPRPCGVSVGGRPRSRPTGRLAGITVTPIEVTCPNGTTAPTTATIGTTAMSGAPMRACSLSASHLVALSVGARKSGEAGFDPDPLGFYADLETPYCWFGIRPTLFDAPSREHRQDMVWVAHSFLCFSPTLGTREVRAVLGFSWGFDIQAGQVRLRPVEALGSPSWDGHLPRLSAAYPNWRFSQGFQTS